MTMKSIAKLYEDDQVGVYTDCCSFLNLGALVVTDVFFDEDSIVDDNRNPQMISIENRNKLHRRRRRKSRKETTEDDGYDDDDNMDEEDENSLLSDYFTVYTKELEQQSLKMMLDDDETKESTHGTEACSTSASELDNTLTNISVLVDSRLSCSNSRETKDEELEQQDHDGRTGVMISEDEENSESFSAIFSMNPTPFLSGDEGMRHRQGSKGNVQKLYNSTRRPSRHRNNKNTQADAPIPAYITSKKCSSRKTSRTPSRLARFFSPGVQRSDSSSPTKSKQEDLDQMEHKFFLSSPPRPLLGAISQSEQCYRASSTGNNFAYKTSAKATRLATNTETIPFDEPLWYN